MTGVSEDSGAPLAIPTQLRKPHRFVTATERAATGVKPEADGRLHIAREGVVTLTVSRTQLRRALLHLQGLFFAAEARGFEIRAVDKLYDTKAGVAIVVRTHNYPIQLVELTDRVALTDEELARWRRDNERRFAWEKSEPPTHKAVANGKLRLSLPSHGDGARCNWTEGPRGTLAEKLTTFFPELERRADEDDRRDEERRRWQEERQRQEQERAERELRARIEQARVGRLEEELSLHRLAAEAREYVAALRARLERDREVEHDERERVGAWCDWVEAWCKRADPTLNLKRIRGLDDERDRFYTPPRQF